MVCQQACAYLPEALQSLNRCGSHTHIRAALFVSIALIEQTCSKGEVGGERIKRSLKHKVVAFWIRWSGWDGCGIAV